MLHYALQTPIRLPCYVTLLLSAIVPNREAKVAQWLEQQTHDQEVSSLSPGRSSRRIFSSRVNFLCWFLFWYPFHPCAVAHKRSWSFCQKWWQQVTAKHTCTLGMWLQIKWICRLVHGCMVNGVHKTCTEMAAVSHGTSHVTTKQLCDHFSGYSKHAV